MTQTNSLTEYIDSVKDNYSSIVDERKPLLQKLVDYVQEKKDTSNPCDLILICTHNSRRSHFSQIWAQVAADHFGFDFVTTYSGGTEATAFNPRAVKAVQQTGLEVINTTPDADNPLYEIPYGDGNVIKAFSKKFEDKTNPQKDFAAVMTCDHVDENCPFVPGAEQRIPLYYIDPKVSDDTPEEEATYGERCFQIATEMFYVFSQIK